jgi:hypothetical protein
VQHNTFNDHIVSGYHSNIEGTGTNQVALNSLDKFQKAMASKPAHMMAEPPDSIGARRLRTIPPTWKRGIIFTGLTVLAKNREDYFDALLTSVSCKFHDSTTAHVPIIKERRV